VCAARLTAPSHALVLHAAAARGCGRGGLDVVREQDGGGGGGGNAAHAFEIGKHF
jgi:hypothetical protein